MNYSMIGQQTYMSNLRLSLWVSEVPGCIVECGTWRGGMIAGIADILGPDRNYILCDSFQGLPLAKEIDGPNALAWQAAKDGAAYHDNCCAEVAEAKAAMGLSAAKNFRIVEGWFENTLPKIDLTEPIALLRMDADWYDSTNCIFDNLLDKMAEHGLIIIDDYYTWDGCTRAVNERAAAMGWRIRQTPQRVCYVAL